jgi:hypothetical protein
MENNERIKEINTHISDALAEWQDIMGMADADEWSYRLEYTEQDLFNAMYIFNHVAQNIAIKNDYYANTDDISNKIAEFRKGVKIGFGFDTKELTHKVLTTKWTK